jgi:glutamyl-tRNA synthetase
VPLLCSSDGQRLSKRQQDLSLAALRQQGIRSEAIVGYLGWQAGLIPQWQPMTPMQLVALFSVKQLKQGNVVVDPNFFTAIG